MEGVPDYYGQFMAPLQRQQQIDIQRQQANIERAELAAKIQKARQEAAMQRQYALDADSVISNPTPEGYRSLMLKYPSMHDGLKAAWDGYSEGEKNRDVSQASQVYAALQNGRADLALSLLKDRKTAQAGAGQDDKVTDQLIEMLESGDEKQVQKAKGIAGFVLATATGPEKIGSTLEALSSMGGNDKGQVVGRAIGHYEDGHFVVDYRDPDAPQYRNVETVDANGNPVTQIVRVGGEGASSANGSGGAGDGGGFDNAIAFTLKHEGGYAASDRNGAPVNMGINLKANPPSVLAKYGIKNLKDASPDQAKALYYDRYWKPSGAESLPAALQTPYFDTYVLNPAKAKQLLNASGGDPNKFLQLRETWLKTLEKSGKYDKAWTNRTNALKALVAGNSSGAGPVAAQPVYQAAKPAAEAEAGLDPATVTLYAQQILAGGQMPALGMGKSATASRQAIMNEVARMAGAEGLTGKDLAVQIGHYKANLANVQNLEKQAGTIEQNENTALLNGQQFLDRSKELPAQTSIPLANSVTQFALRHTGNPTIAAMDAAWTTFTTEYAKVVSGSPSGAGVLSDSARHEAMDTMRGNYSYAQKVAAFNQMKADMANRMAAIHSQVAKGYDNLGARAPGIGVNGKAPAPKKDDLPKGAKVIGTYHGKRVIEINGKRMVEQ